MPGAIALVKTADQQDPAKAPPYEYSQKGYQNILDVCATAGLEITHET